MNSYEDKFGCRHVNERLITGNSAYVGLAPPGEVGSWQKENKVFLFMFFLTINLFMVNIFGL